MAEITNGFYNTNNGVYVTDHQYVWEYKYFYHGQDEVQLVAKELRTGTFVFQPLFSEGDMQKEIQNILDEETVRIVHRD
ncbi:hypothetical protein ACFQO8_14590 [Exiguobacterium aestuarii]|uniref:Uncharacterized protein n=1 Tax=Exiguobacterium aestuarii TaxID=273527 RepID=A0ABW2PPW3_9BACL|nr:MULTISPECIES: hypothetical protein [Exiguobacterium]MCT4786253.1 hypothetical protein [Exiguobacterium aestuarii]